MSAGARVLLMAALASAAACSNPASTLQSSPFQPSPTERYAFTVSGTLWVYRSSGVARADSGALWAWIQTGGSGRSVGPLRVDSAGNYEVVVPSGGARVYIKELQFQPCAASRIVTGDTRIDVHKVTDVQQLGGNLPAALQAQQPTLSGVVYEQTPAGRIPVPNARVELDALDGMGVPIADTLSDSEGRYLLCGVPQISSLWLYAGATGFPLYSRGSLLGMTTLDIEMRRQ